MNDLALLAARFATAPKGQTNLQEVSEPQSTGARGKEDVVRSDPATAPIHFIDTDAPIVDATVEIGREPVGENILEFGRLSVSSGAEQKAIVRSTARQKLTVIKLFIDITGKHTFHSLKQADIKKFVDTMALLPTVRRRSKAERELTIEELIAKGRTLPSKQVGLAARTVNRNLCYVSVLINQASWRV